LEKTTDFVKKLTNKSCEILNSALNSNGLLIEIFLPDNSIKPLGVPSQDNCKHYNIVNIFIAYSTKKERTIFIIFIVYYRIY